MKSSAPVKRANGSSWPGAARRVQTTGVCLNPSSELTRVSLCKAGKGSQGQLKYSSPWL